MVTRDRLQHCIRLLSVLGCLLNGSKLAAVRNLPDTFPAPIGNNSLGYVRVQQMGEAGMGDGRENEDFPEIVRTVEYSEAFLRSLLGFLPPPGRLVLVTGKGTP